MSLRAETLRPPAGGAPSRDRVRLADGTMGFLAPLAHTVAERHLAEFPDEAERYGPAGFEWCVHDVQWILGWAASEVEGNAGLLARQLAWLGDLLAARNYPRERLTRAVEIAADVVEQRHGEPAYELAAVLRAGAGKGA